MASHGTTSFYFVRHGLSAWTPETINPAVRFLWVVFGRRTFDLPDERLCVSDWLS